LTSNATATAGAISIAVFSIALVTAFAPTNNDPVRAAAAMTKRINSA
jgi:hypothetical protein